MIIFRKNVSLVCLWIFSLNNLKKINDLTEKNYSEIAQIFLMFGALHEQGNKMTDEQLQDLFVHVKKIIMRFGKNESSKESEEDPDEENYIIADSMAPMLAVKTQLIN